MKNLKQLQQRFASVTTSWSYAVEAAEQSRGEIDMVSDEEILHAYRLLAKTEGVFAEPGSNASLAGVIKHVESGKIKREKQLLQY